MSEIRSPPYVSYQTFKNKVREFESHLPSRIDTSVLKTMSGAAQSQFLGALRFFELVGDGDTSLPLLQKLASSTVDDWPVLMADLLRTHYMFAVDELKEGTPASLDEKFKDFGKHSVTEKMSRFLINAATDSSLEVSPTIKKAKSTPVARRTRRRNGRGDTVARPATQANRPSQPPPNTSSSYEQVLLSKFPEFDPAWGPEIQKQWFEGFQRLMEIKGKAET